jgi:hypothetical protein
MSCPLCGGPLHVEDATRFVCERQHAMNAEQLQVAAATRVTTALWYSIEALQAEADALRVLATLDGGDGSAEMAERAEADAMVLRELAGAHVPAGQSDGS